MKYMLLALLLCLAVSACNQSEGEAETMGDKVGAAIEDATEATADFATDATMAATVTPSIKSAIIADPGLNSPENVIDVSSKDRKVYLTGHVGSAELKSRAQEIASGWLSKSAAPDDVTLVNELEVKGRPLDG
jgi:osmotically-inducible protein OsmY